MHEGDCWINKEAVLAISVVLLAAFAIVYIVFLPPSYHYYVMQFIDTGNQENSVLVNFPQNTMNELNMKWDETWQKNIEYHAYLEIENLTAKRVTFIGEKNLITGKIRVYTIPSSLITNSSIHSHPNGICLESEIDMLLDKPNSINCIQCGPSRIRCFEHE